MISFRPYWITPAQSSVTVIEDDVVSLTYVAITKAVHMAKAGDVNFIVGPQAADMNEVRVNGQPTPFYTAGDSVVLVAPLVTDAVVEFILATPPFITLLNGDLPNGLIMINGMVSGTVKNVQSLDPVEHVFTLRATTSEGIKSDREYFIWAQPIGYPPKWDFGELPNIQFDPFAGVSYRKLATLRRGEAFTYILSATDADGDPILGEIIKVPGLVGYYDVFNQGLPSGLGFISEDRRIEGIVNATAPEGKYVFRVKLLGTGAPSPLTFMIEVKGGTPDALEVPVRIKWLTPSGNLGTLWEAYPSYFGVRATSSTALPVYYDLAPSSGALPLGVTINHSSGDIEGIPLGISRDVTINLVIRASVGRAFADRKFSFRVLNRYTTASILEICYRFREYDRWRFYEQYMNLIPAESVFRPDDVLFGIVRHPKIYVARGFAPDADVQTAMMDDGNGKVRDDFHGTFEFVLGPHELAVARDFSGKVIYEVIYRRVYDPQQNAGGFSRDPRYTTPEQENIEWVQSPPDDPKYVYPVSLRNNRLDFIDELGFATLDDNLKHVPGPSGIEAMPLWMLSRQTASNAATVPGYVPAIVVANVLPGKGADLVTMLNKSRSVTINGQQYQFDRYTSIDARFEGMTFFDDNTTTFEGDNGEELLFQTTFDGELTDSIKYYRF